MSHQRKFFPAKFKNFAVGPIRESFFQRKFLTLKYIMMQLHPFYLHCRGLYEIPNSVHVLLGKRTRINKKYLASILVERSFHTLHRSSHQNFVHLACVWKTSLSDEPGAPDFKNNMVYRTAVDYTKLYYYMDYIKLCLLWWHIVVVYIYHHGRTQTN